MNNKSLYSSVNHSNRVYFFLSTLALSIGGIIYIFFRTTEPVFFKWINTVGLDSWFNSGRGNLFSKSFQLPEWMVFSLPNGLWAFAYALLITCIWSGGKSWLKYFWMATIPVLVVGFEVLQYAGIIRGTFCIQDLAFGMAGLVLGIIVGIKSTKSHNHEKACK